MIAPAEKMSQTMETHEIINGGGDTVRYASMNVDGIRDEFMHCDFGPAYITSRGSRYYWMGVSYSFDEWLTINDVLDDEQKVLLKLQERRV